MMSTGIHWEDSYNKNPALDVTSNPIINIVHLNGTSKKTINYCSFSQPSSGSISHITPFRQVNIYNSCGVSCKLSFWIKTKIESNSKQNKLNICQDNTMSSIFMLMKWQM